MRILLVTQDDPIYVREFFDELKNVDLTGARVIGIVVAPTLGKSGFGALLRQMWNFYGPFDFVRMGIRFCISKLGAHLPEFLRAGRSYSIEQAGADLGIPVKKVSKLNSPDFIAWVKEQNTDLIASIAAPQIFRPALIAAPKMGCINIHNARLPNYRGMLPNFWQMYDGNREVGLTIHRISEGIDEGPILYQGGTAVLEGDTLDSLIRRTKREGAHTLFDTIRDLAEGKIAEKPNPRDEGSYFSFPSRADVAEFRRRGFRLL